MCIWYIKLGPDVPSRSSRTKYLICMSPIQMTLHWNQCRHRGHAPAKGHTSGFWMSALLWLTTDTLHVYTSNGAQATFSRLSLSASAFDLNKLHKHFGTIQHEIVIYIQNYITNIYNVCSNWLIDWWLMITYTVKGSDERAQMNTHSDWQWTANGVFCSFITYFVSYKH